MSWRPSLHYLLRSCKISEDKEKERKGACTIFAKHDRLLNDELQKKVKILEDKVQPVAKHIAVLALLKEKIETIDFSSHPDIPRHLYQKLQHVINEAPYEEIPISWVFLRSLFYRFDRNIIARAELKEMAEKCGMDEDSLTGFCKFYTSFGSIFDLSLVDSKYQHVILKPFSFLKSLNSLFSSNTEKYPMKKSGIVPEDLCRDLFDGNMMPFMSALVSLNLAVQVIRPQLKLSENECDNYYYYIPQICANNITEKIDPKSIHVLTSIDTPHIFKQVKFTRHLLRLRPEAKLIPSNYRNRTIIEDVATGTTITLTSHSPAIKLHLNKPSIEVCSCIIRAYNEIAEEAISNGMIVKYKFIKICSEVTASDVQSIPSSRYHILPNDELCSKCNEDSNEEKELLKAWNEALKVL